MGDSVVEAGGARPVPGWLFDVGAGAYRWFTDQAPWRESCASLASRLENGDGAVVLDLGCGPGTSTAAVAVDLPGARLIGLDIAPRMLARARAGSAGRPWADRVSWLRADARRLPLGAGSVDAATGHSFLYLAPDRTQVLAEVLRVLRPGGRLVLMEPNARRPGLGAALRVSRDPRHLVATSLWRWFSGRHGRFDVGSMTTILEGAGFTGCEVTETLGGLGVLASGDRPSAAAV